MNDKHILWLNNMNNILSTLIIGIGIYIPERNMSESCKTMLLYSIPFVNIESNFCRFDYPTLYQYYQNCFCNISWFQIMGI